MIRAPAGAHSSEGVRRSTRLASVGVWTQDAGAAAFEELVQDSGLRLPRVRRWYVNADDRFLGADELSDLRVVVAGSG